MNNTNYNWRLQNVDDIAWEPDRSGVYCLINWQVQTNTVRLDIMSDKHEPLQSFAGESDNVRKATLNWMSDNIYDTRPGFSGKITGVSLTHAGYIGSELQKADIFRIDYIQDDVIKSTSDKKDLPDVFTDRELIDKVTSDNKEQAEKILQKFASDNEIVCSKCGYSQCGFSSDNILMCLDCGETWPSDNRIVR